MLLLLAPVASWVLGLVEELGNEVRRGDFVGVETSEAFVLIVVAFIIIEVLVEWGYFIVCEVVTGGRPDEDVVREFVFPD